MKKEKEEGELVLLEMPIETFMFCQLLLETHIEIIANDVSILINDGNEEISVKERMDYLIEYCKDLNFSFWKHLKKNTTDKEYQRMKIIYKNGTKSNNEILEILNDIGL